MKGRIAYKMSVYLQMPQPFSSSIPARPRYPIQEGTPCSENKNLIEKYPARQKRTGE